MKIRGVLVDIFCEMEPSYKQYIIIENGQKVLYIHTLSRQSVDYLY